MITKNKIKLFIISFFILFFTSCKFMNNDVLSYFKEYTETSAIGKHSFEKIFPVDKNNITCLDSSSEQIIHLYLRNPQNYFLRTSYEFDNEALNDYNFPIPYGSSIDYDEEPEFYQDEKNPSEIQIKFPKAFLQKVDIGEIKDDENNIVKDISGTIHIVHEDTGREFETYHLSLIANSMPPEPVSAMFQVDDNNNLILCIAYNHIKDTVHQNDTKTIQIGNDTWSFNGDFSDITPSPSNTQNGTLSTTKPENLYELNGLIFDNTNTTDYVYLYYYSNILTSEDILTYNIILKDDFGLNSITQASTKSIKLSPVNIEKIAGDLFYSDEEDYTYITITHDGTTTNGESCSTNDLKICYNIYKNNILEASSYDVGPSIKVKVHSGSDYTLKAYAYKPSYVQSDTETYGTFSVLKSAHYFVNGKDSANPDGSIDRPYKTIQKAIDEIRNNTIYDDERLFIINIMDNLYTDILDTNTSFGQISGSISKKFLIQGYNNTTYTLDGNNTKTIFYFNDPNSEIIIKNLNLINGKNNTYENESTGGGIYNNSKLTLDNVTIQNCQVSSTTNNSFGGAIYNKSILTLNDVIIDSCIAYNENNNSDKHKGGGIYNSGSLTINKAIITGCQTYYKLNDSNSKINGSGGAIYNEGTLTLGDSKSNSDNSPDVIIGVGTYYHSNDTKGVVYTKPNEASCGAGVYNYKNAYSSATSPSFIMNEDCVIGKYYLETDDDLENIYGNVINLDTQVTHEGVGLYFNKNITTNFFGGYICYNKSSNNNTGASVDGVGIYSKSNLNLKNVTIAYNYASLNNNQISYSYRGIGIYSDEADIILEGTTKIYNNTHAELQINNIIQEGIGIYFLPSSLGNNITIKDNTWLSDQDDIYLGSYSYNGTNIYSQCNISSNLSPIDNEQKPAEFVATIKPGTYTESKQWLINPSNDSKAVENNYNKFKVVPYIIQTKTYYYDFSSDGKINNVYYLAGSDCSKLVYYNASDADGSKDKPYNSLSSVFTDIYNNVGSEINHILYLDGTFTENNSLDLDFRNISLIKYPEATKAIITTNTNDYNSIFNFRGYASDKNKYTVTFQDITIDGNDKIRGLIINSIKLNLQGSTQIINCKIDKDDKSYNYAGAGINATASNIIMKDQATIQNCKIERTSSEFSNIEFEDSVGAGICLKSGEFTMQDSAKIINCSITNDDNIEYNALGAGVYINGEYSIVSNSTMFNMHDDASISNCTCTVKKQGYSALGNGVYLYSSCKLTISGNASISGGQQSNHDIYLDCESSWKTYDAHYPHIILINKQDKPLKTTNITKMNIDMIPEGYTNYSNNALISLQSDSSLPEGKTYNDYFKLGSNYFFMDNGKIFQKISEMESKPTGITTFYIFDYDDLMTISNDSWEFNNNEIYTFLNDIDMDGKKLDNTISIFGNQVTFNGNSKTIKNITEPIFNIIDSNCTLENLNIEGKSNAFNGAYGLANTNEGKIRNCTVKVDINPSDDINPYNLGGLVLKNEGSGKIENCEFKGSITLSEKEFTGTFIIPGSSTTYTSLLIIGGISADNSSPSSSIENCINSGEIKISNISDSNNNLILYIGGITGYTYSNIKSSENSDIGIIELDEIKNFSEVDIGGITGYCFYTSKSPLLENCKNEAEISLKNIQLNDSNKFVYCGGIAGRTQNTKINKCINTGNITTIYTNSLISTACVGGICGYNTCRNTNSPSTIYNSCNKASIQGDIAGGIVGFNESFVYNSYNTGTISYTENSTKNYIGGICGSNNSTNAKIILCYNVGDIEITGNFCHGIYGIDERTDTNGNNIIYCFSKEIGNDTYIDSDNYNKIKGIRKLLRSEEPYLIPSHWYCNNNYRGANNSNNDATLYKVLNLLISDFYNSNKDDFDQWQEEVKDKIEHCRLAWEIDQEE